MASIQRLLKPPTMLDIRISRRATMSILRGLAGHSSEYQECATSGCIGPKLGIVRRMRGLRMYRMGSDRFTGAATLSQNRIDRPYRRAHRSSGFGGSPLTRRDV